MGCNKKNNCDTCQHFSVRSNLMIMKLFEANRQKMSTPLQFTISELWNILIIKNNYPFFCVLNWQYFFFLTGFSISSNPIIIYAPTAANQSNSKSKSEKKPKSSCHQLYWLAYEKRVRLTNRHQHTANQSTQKQNEKSQPMRAEIDVMRAFNSINGNMCRQYLSWAIVYNAIINISMLSKHMREPICEASKRNPKRICLRARYHRVHWISTIVCRWMKEAPFW